MKLMAPFTPFITEEIYQKLKTKNDLESVHLCDYPKPLSFDNSEEEDLEIINNNMAWARAAINLILAQRSKEGIKVRQPLGSVRVSDKIDNITFNSKYREEIIDLIKEETNIKEVGIDFNVELTENIKLNTVLTAELKEEGTVREIIRQIQQMRKDARLVPADRINVLYQNAEFFDKILINNKKTILKEVLADGIAASDNIPDGKEIKIDNHQIILGVTKTN